MLIDQVAESKAFRRWRRSRPFWGGLLTFLAGVEMFLSTQMSLGGLTFQMGPTGFLSWLIPTIIAAAGALMVFTPDQRMFYAIVAAVATVYSLIGVNLGGFFIGLLLGLVGSALGFAWTPVDPATESRAGTGQAEDGSQEEDPNTSTASFDELMTGPEANAAAAGRMDAPEQQAAGYPPTPAPYHAPQVPGVPHGPQRMDDATREIPAQRAPFPQESGSEGEPPAGYDPRPSRGPQALAITLVLLTASTVGVAVVRGASPAQAEPNPCVTATTGTITPSATPTGATKTPAGGEDDSTGGGKPEDKPAPTPTATPTTSPTPGTDSGDGGGSVVEKIGDAVSGAVDTVVEGVKDLLGVGEAGTAAEASPTPTASPSPTAKAKKKKAKASPTATATPAPTEKATKKKTKVKATKTPAASPTSSNGCSATEGTAIKTLAAETGQAKVATKPGALTGSKVTMFGLIMNGVTTLPTADGTIKVLKFSMAKAVTEDFKLVTSGSDSRTVTFETNELTIEGNVEFYATRFSGKLFGLGNPIEFTAESGELPFDIPVLIPIFFTDPEIQLVFVDCDKLTAKPTLKVTPA